MNRFTWYRLIMSVITIAGVLAQVLAIALWTAWLAWITVGCIVAGIILDGMWPYYWKKW